MGIGIALGTIQSSNPYRAVLMTVASPNEEGLPEGKYPDPAGFAAHVRVTGRLDDGVRRGLDPKYVPAERIANWIGTAVLSVLALVGLPILLFAIDEPAWVTVALGAGAAIAVASAALYSWLWPPLDFRRTSWVLNGVGIEIRRGVWWKHVISVPRTRIQHTDVAQGPVQRRFGLATLVIHTAGMHAYEVNLHGLARETALRVRDTLLRTEESPTTEEGRNA